MRCKFHARVFHFHRFLYFIFLFFFLCCVLSKHFRVLVLCERALFLFSFSTHCVFSVVPFNRLPLSSIHFSCRFYFICSRFDFCCCWCFYVFCSFLPSFSGWRCYVQHSFFFWFVFCVNKNLSPANSIQFSISFFRFLYLLIWLIHANQ